MKRISQLFLWFLFAVPFLFWGCQDQEADPSYQYVKSFSKIGTFSQADLKARFGNDASVSSIIAYDVTAYKVTYTTKNWNDSTVVASGLFLLPDKPSNVNLISYQHGTITSQEQAPSAYNQKGTEAYYLATLFAANGYAVSLPDYIGYGSTSSLVHPYEEKHTLATTSLDMIRAVTEYAKRNKMGLNGDLYLAGYSEGGFATMALQKYIQEKTPDEFNVIASAPGAGAYHTSAFAKYLAETPGPQPIVPFYLWLIDTYNKAYNINESWDYYLKKPYADTIQAAAGEGIAQFYAIHTDVVDSILNDNFQQILIDQPANDPFVKALKDNDIYDWKPMVPTKMYHSKDDHTVPVFNTEDAYAAMKANGAPDVQVQYFTGYSHVEAANPYATDVLTNYFKFIVFQ